MLSDRTWKFVQQSITPFAYLPGYAHFTQTVDNSLSYPAIDIERLGQVAGVEWGWQWTGD